MNQMTDIICIWFIISYIWSITIGLIGIAEFCDDNKPIFKQIWRLPFVGIGLYDKFNIIGTLIVTIVLFVGYFPMTLTISIISLVGYFIIKLFTRNNYKIM